MGIFGEFKEMGAAIIKRGAAASSKDEIIADRFFALISSKGVPMKNSVRQADRHFATFDMGDNFLDVTVQRRVSTTPRVGVGPISIPLGITPTMCDISLRVYPKGGGFFAKLGAGSTLRYVINADDHIDDNLQIKNPQALDELLASYLRATGL